MPRTDACLQSLMLAAGVGLNLLMQKHTIQRRPARVSVTRPLAQPLAPGAVGSSAAGIHTVAPACAARPVVSCRVPVTTDAVFAGRRGRGNAARLCYCLRFNYFTSRSPQRSISQRRSEPVLSR